MSSLEDKNLLLVWALLVAVTLLSWLIGANDGHHAFVRNPAITFGVLFIALVKVRLIVRRFMAVSHAPVLLGWLTDTWLVLAMAVLLGLYTGQVGLLI